MIRKTIYPKTMTDEEKEAVNDFENYISAIDKFGTIDYKCINNLYNPSKTLLNLVQKQEKIIDEMIKEFVSITHYNGEDKTYEEIKQYFEDI